MKHVHWQTVVSATSDAGWDAAVARAAEWLRKGELVAFPTETVYGLGADALNPEAVARIFAAKGRPSDNPLIVHIADMDGLAPLVLDIPPVADRLMNLFWPGALTLVFRRSAAVPDVVTAGLDTVAVRMPVHPVARRLIRAAGIPVAAPSANRSGRPSPTRAAHVREDMEGRIPMILDGGPCEVGVESTVLDVTVMPPMILRPGGVTREMIEAAIGPIALDPALAGEAERPRAPGMKYAHYAPTAPMTLYEGEAAAVAERMRQEASRLAALGRHVGVLCSAEWHAAWRGQTPEDRVLPIEIGSRQSPEVAAAGIFAALRAFDAAGVDVILAEGVLESGVGHAVMNRLRKAAGGRIVRCGKGDTA